eukprot:528684-Pelagomonas_calceolata.AAC.2
MVNGRQSSWNNSEITLELLEHRTGTIYIQMTQSGSITRLAPPTAVYAAMRIASITLSSDVHTQLAQGCSQTDKAALSLCCETLNFKLLVAKVNMAYSFLP